MAHRAALSRTTKEDYPSSVIHNHIDLTSSAQEMAKDLKSESSIRLLRYLPPERLRKKTEKWTVASP